VRLHRAADVDQDEQARGFSRRGRRQAGATGTPPVQAGAQRAAHVQPRPRGCVAPAAREARAQAARRCVRPAAAAWARSCGSHIGRRCGRAARRCGWRRPGRAGCRRLSPAPAPVERGVHRARRRRCGRRAPSVLVQLLHHWRRSRDGRVWPLTRTVPFSARGASSARRGRASAASRARRGRRWRARPRRARAAGAGTRQRGLHHGLLLGHAHLQPVVAQQGGETGDARGDGHSRAVGPASSGRRAHARRRQAGAFSATPTRAGLR
jgi:hypothetical protein